MKQLAASDSGSCIARLILAALGFCAPVASAQQAVQWRVEDGGNGHWYKAVANGAPICWEGARDAAVAVGGHLVTLTSAAEDAWVCANVVQPSAGMYPPGCGWDGPMTGGFKLSGDAWQWVTGEPFSYSHFVWSNGNGQEMIQYFNGGCGWDGTGYCGGACGGNHAFLIEWSADCNNDGAVDYGQILIGQIEDSDQDGVPDVCEQASTRFTFSFSDDGWTNQATEPFDVHFVPEGGFGGGGGLRVSGDARDSFQLVHAWNGHWPAVSGAFALITIDFRAISLAGDLYLPTTGVQIRDSAGTESTVYLADRLVDLGGGWSRIEFKPTCLADLPLSHNDVGLNVHFGFTGYQRNTFHIDNIIGTPTPDIGFEDEDDDGIPDKCEASPCPGDAVHDGIVDANDLALVLSQWGTEGGSPSADVDGDGMVEGKDLAIVISAWGPCIAVPPWATLLDARPDPTVVTNNDLRTAITASGYAWRVLDTATQIEMVLIPPGTYPMGCNYCGSLPCPCAPYWSPMHSVTITRPFYMGRYEVTQGQWTAAMGSNPSSFRSPSAHVTAAQVSSRPVESVSWDMIQGFLAETSMRLPTEAESEYAYRAGTTTRLHGFLEHPAGTDDPALVGSVAWYNGNADSQTRPVGQKLPNGFGLHDMEGNVSEWVSDWSTWYPGSAQTDPSGPPSGSGRAIRGAGWPAYLGEHAAYARRTYAPWGTFGDTGFRVARNP